MSHQKLISKLGYIFAVISLMFLIQAGTFNSPQNKMSLNNVLKDSISTETQDCIDCHLSVTPGIVKDWETSRHSRTIVKDAMMKPALVKRISAEKIPEKLHMSSCRSFAI
ncbi:MAG: hypothetical protein P8Z35_09070 [Ignavibacteriaceae bacterium]